MNEHEESGPVWELRTLHQAYKKRKPTEWVVEGVFSTESLGAFYGPPGSYKSMLMADLAAHVVAGTPWMPGGASIPTVQSPVLWVDMDNGTRRTDERIDAVAKAHNLPVDAPFYYISMPSPPLIAHDVDSMIILRDSINSTGARFVVIDNLGLITGDVEENSSQMAFIMGNLRTVCERTGAAIVLIHHQRKGGSNGGRAGDALRGHSSIEAALDLALLVTREAGEKEVRVVSTKTRGVDVPAMMARFYYEHVTGTTDLAMAYFEGLPTASDKEAAMKETMYNLLRVAPLTKTLLATRVKESGGDTMPGVNVIRGMIDQMLAEGELVENTAKGNKKLVDLPRI
jgi:RecA-family ATPase